VAPGNRDQKTKQENLIQNIFCSRRARENWVFRIESGEGFGEVPGDEGEKRRSPHACKKGNSQKPSDPSRSRDRKHKKDGLVLDEKVRKLGAEKGGGLLSPRGGNQLSGSRKTQAERLTRGNRYTAKDTYIWKEEEKKGDVCRGSFRGARKVTATKSRGEEVCQVQKRGGLMRQRAEGNANVSVREYIDQGRGGGS